MKRHNNDPVKAISGINRKEFLITSGIGLAALASGPALGAVPRKGVGRPIGFRFVANSFSSVVDGVQHQAGLSGEGHVTRHNVHGGGTFFHLIFTSAVPKTLVASGTWKAKRLISLELAGQYGSVAAGILQMWIHLVPTDGSVVAAKLKMVCNLAPAGISTGEEEGFMLDIPGTQFTEGESFGAFGPAVPPSGLTIFNLLNEHKD